METKEFRGPGFVMEIPTHWLISSTTDFQAIFLSPRKEDGTQANLTVSIRQLDEGSTLEAVVEVLQNTQHERYPQFNVLEEVDYSESGGSGFKQIYSWFNEEQNATIIQTQALFYVERLLFTLIGTAFQPHADEYQDIFNTMIDSFRLSV